MHIAEDPRFKEHLMRPTVLEVVLRGHLWAESELIGVLEELLPFPQHIDLSRLGFPLKVALVAAHGRLPADDIPAYLKLNSLRNRIAHNLHSELTEEQVDELYHSFGARFNYLHNETNPNALLNSSDEASWIGRLRAAIAYMCIALSSEREKILEEQRQQRETIERYNKLVERLKADKANWSSNQHGTT